MDDFKVRIGQNISEILPDVAPEVQPQTEQPAGGLSSIADSMMKFEGSSLFDQIASQGTVSPPPAPDTTAPAPQAGSANIDWQSILNEMKSAQQSGFPVDGLIGLLMPSFTSQLEGALSDPNMQAALQQGLQTLASQGGPLADNIVRAAVNSLANDPNFKLSDIPANLLEQVKTILENGDDQQLDQQMIQNTIDPALGITSDEDPFSSGPGPAATPTPPAASSSSGGGVSINIDWQSILSEVKRAQQSGFPVDELIGLLMPSFTSQLEGALIDPNMQDALQQGLQTLASQGGPLADNIVRAAVNSLANDPNFKLSDIPANLLEQVKTMLENGDDQQLDQQMIQNTIDPALGVTSDEDPFSSSPGPAATPPPAASPSSGGGGVNVSIDWQSILGEMKSAQQSGFPVDALIGLLMPSLTSQLEGAVSDPNMQAALQQGLQTLASQGGTLSDDIVRAAVNSLAADPNFKLSDLPANLLEQVKTILENGDDQQLDQQLIQNTIDPALQIANSQN
ncbi:MAG: hypothetical protein C5B54_12385 [Acidobacteria bacterium]|nr:MAG: hypothetical protein C5B54_12385 [Acidobacteriota bacterium]